MAFNMIIKGILFVCLLSSCTRANLNLLENPFGSLESLVDNVKTPLEKLVPTVVETVTDAAEGVTTTTTTALSNAGKGILQAGSDLVENIVNPAEKLVPVVAETVTNVVGGVSKTTATTISDTGKGIIQAGNDLTDEVKEAYSKQILDRINNIVYTLYTRAINDTPVNITQDDWPKLRHHAMLDRDFKFMTHGWMSSGDSDTLIDIKDAYLTDRDINVVIVDWSAVAGNLLYPIPAILTDHIGSEYGKLLNYLIQNGIQLNLLHMIGHSLGAHVSGFAARSITTGKPSRLTGLDPALPGFSDFYGLRKTDADFVDIIHSCAGALGVLESIGDVDFFPNGGTPPQPGCAVLQTPILSCSHGRSHQYFAASIDRSNQFLARSCSSWLKYELSESCDDGGEAFMGDPVSFSARGDFYLKTSPDFPYAMGNDS